MYEVTNKYKELIKRGVWETSISGRIRLKSGDVIDISDSNIKKGSLSIDSKLNSRGDFRPGGVYSSELSITLQGFEGAASDLDGAMIVPKFRIHDGSRYEEIPLGVFFADGSSIKRKSNIVSLKADDRLMFFDKPSVERSGALYDLVSDACGRCSVSLKTSRSKFLSFPNGNLNVSVDISRVQTERDLLMYVGMTTMTFARMSRDGRLEFIPLTCQIDENTNTVVPVREILGDIRYKTEFSDDTTRVTKVFTRRKGKAIFSNVEIESGGSEKFTCLEMYDNPFFAEMKEDDIITALNNDVRAVYKCINRAYRTEFKGDPALDIGDFVRLRGGEIDTARGYCTGMITSQIWRYRGKHTIKCTMPPYVEDSGEISAFALSDDTSIQPKSQLEKRVDMLEANTGTYIAIRDANAPELLHAFTQVRYSGGERKGYGDAQNPIVCQGYVCDRVRENGVHYERASFSSGVHETYAGDSYPQIPQPCEFSVELNYINSSSNTAYWEYHITSPNQDGKISTNTGFFYFNIDSVLSEPFIDLNLREVHAPTNKFPYGYALVYVYPGYIDLNGNFRAQVGTSRYWYALSFGSMSEYQAAVAMTTEPVEHGEIIDTTTLLYRGSPLKLIDHTPTLSDLTGANAIIAQYSGAPVLTGEKTKLFRVVDLFAESTNLQQN